MTSEFLTQLGPIALKAMVGLVFTGLIGAIMWPVRKAKKEWVALKTNLQETHKELVQQRTNCLTTLQQQGETQIELLGKTVAALDGVRLDLREQMGILRVPPRARVARRKK
jgi:C4-dicarboxylate-specific signal transduction histidine kinase